MSDSDEEVINERHLKVILLGESGSGKTALCLRFIQDQFFSTYQPTMGVEFYAKTLRLNNQISVSLQIWDVGGQQFESSMLDKYVLGSDVIIFAYDVTNSASFDRLKEWHRMVQRLSSMEERKVQLALVGTKTDLEHERTIKLEKHQEFAKRYHMLGFQTSAKLGDSVALCFLKTASEALGVLLHRSELESNAPVLRAEVPTIERITDAQTSEIIWPPKSRTCVLQ
uniref:Ras-related protein Rab-28 n=1 Tax=Trichuris muris TaxID=70415 RepID=A0A5S6QZP6_TRIMR